MNVVTSAGACRIRATARLHLGFVDMHGGFGRKFGSVGVSLAEPAFDLSVRPAPVLEVAGEEQERVRLAAERFLHLRREAGEKLQAGHLQVNEVIPAHRGFGSGTQLVLAVSRGLARLNGLTLSNRELMQVMGRGRRSGVGLGAFEHGGLILDGGKGKDGLPPPQLARLSMPDAWRVILIEDSTGVGMRGVAEDEAFEKLPRFSANCAAYLSRVMLMELLPGVASGDFASFSAAVTRLQDTTGDYFSSVQGGRYASSSVGRLIEYFRERGIKGVGQSSWGPTGFVFTPDEQHARQLVAMVKQEQSSQLSNDLELSITCFNNEGALIDSA